MKPRRHGLKALRDIALAHCTTPQPDLALLARALGREIHGQSERLAQGLIDLSANPRGFERWQLVERRSVSVLLMVWPVDYMTPVHDHGGLWGLEMTLAGALEVQSYTRHPDGRLQLRGTDWLGPGDARWFDASDDGYVHRCRNLSRHEATLSLHLYGGPLTHYHAFEQHGTADVWAARPRRSAIAGVLTP